MLAGASVLLLSSIGGRALADDNTVPLPGAGPLVQARIRSRRPTSRSDPPRKYPSLRALDTAGADEEDKGKQGEE